ncbi:MAG: iron ABC transporter permease [Lachnospiraceae bacterium]|nr:iron ABC transporter permease [Lachnospiraceae bacterium]
MNATKTGRLNAGWKIVLIVLPIVTALIALGIGRYLISPADVIEAIVGRFTGNYEISEMAYKTVWNLRIPRILLALLVGAGLSTAGCAFQSLFANPLATPDTLGVASGASFGAALGILLGLDMLGMQLTSFAMGALAVTLTWLGGSGKGRGLSSVVLSGIMMGSLFNALVSLVKYVADAETQLPAITYWLMGGLNSAGYQSLKFGAPPIIIGIAVLYLIRWRMNLLPLSEDEAKSSGINIYTLRIVTIICATMITASCVSMCGQVGWVGLLIPHMCRMKFGSNHLSLLPASISFGAVFMVIVDTLARSMTASEIPVSILTAIIGAPFFIILMRRSGGWQG